MVIYYLAKKNQRKLTKCLILTGESLTQSILCVFRQNYVRDQRFCVEHFNSRQYNNNIIIMLIFKV